MRTSIDFIATLPIASGFFHGLAATNLKNFLPMPCFRPALRYGGTIPRSPRRNGRRRCVVTSDIPENRELVDGAGFTFRRGDVEDLGTRTTESGWRSGGSPFRRCSGKAENSGSLSLARYRVPHRSCILETYGEATQKKDRRLPRERPSPGQSLRPFVWPR